MEFIITVREVSLIVGVWVAIYGIDSWRREHTDKRQIELAEETLELFYAARDAISYIRFPVKLEFKDLDNASQTEVENGYKTKFDPNIVFNRYNKNKELFNKIHSMRYRFMAQFGEKNAIQFDELRNVIDEIFISAKMLSNLSPATSFKNDKSWNDYLKHVEKHESVLWDFQKKDDQVSNKVDKLVNNIENLCRDVVAGRGTLFYLINKSIFK